MKKFAEVILIGINTALASYGAYSLYQNTKEKRAQFKKEFEEDLQKDLEKLERDMEAVNKRFEKEDVPVGDSGKGEAC